MNISALQKIYKTFYLLESESEKLYSTGAEIDVATKAKIEALERKIAVGKLMLRNTDPELARTLSRLNINIVSPDDPYCKTMAVDNFGNIYINPDFSTKLTEDEFFGVFAHEALHIANRTFLRKGLRNHTWWNIATDAVMNWALSRDGYALPKEGIIPDSMTGKVKIKMCKREFSFTVLNPQDGEPLSAEMVYKQIEEISNNLQKLVEDGKVDPRDCDEEGKEGKEGKQGKEGKGKEGKGKEDGEAGDGQGAGAVAGQGGNRKMTQEEARQIVDRVLKKLDNKTDTHLTDEQARQTKADLDEVITPEKQKQLEDDIKRGLKELESSPNYGRGGNKTSYIRNILKSSLPPDNVDWRKEMKSFLQQAGKASYNWSTLSRRGLAAGVPMPGKAKATAKLDAIFALDTSGSVGDKQLFVCTDYINKIAKTAKDLNVRILLWSDDAYWCSPPLGTQSSVKTVMANIKKHVKYGGNDMSDIERYIKQNGLKPYCVIYVTDGQEPKEPRFGNYKKLFVIVSSYLEATKPAIERMFRKHGKIVYTTELK